MKCCDKILEINSKDASTLNNKGWLLSKYFGDHKSALEYINRSLDINPHEANTHHSLGYVLSALGMHKKAIDSFDTAI